MQPLETVTIERDGRVLIVRHVDPPMNFVTAAFIRDLDRVTAAVDRDRGIGAVVLTGGVRGRFLTHADPTELGDAARGPLPPLPPAVLRPLWRATRAALALPGALRVTEGVGGPVAQALAWGHRWRRAILRMNRSSAVYLAAINGPATGGGHEIALACDLRFVSDAPDIRLGQMESLAGLIPGGGGTQRLPRILGTAAALEHMLEGIPVSAARAAELGLVNAVVADADLLTHTLAVAHRLARRSPMVVGQIKRLTYFASSRSWPRGLDAEMGGFLGAGLQPPMADTLDAFAADLAADGDSPLSTGRPDWVDGTRVDQVGVRPPRPTDAGVVGR